MRSLGAAALDLREVHAELAREAAHAGARMGHGARLGAGCRGNRSGARGRSRRRRGAGAGAAMARRCRSRHGRRRARRRRLRAGGMRRTRGARTTMPSLTLSPTLTLQLLHHAGGGRGHLHRRLVAFQRDERIFLLHRVTGLHQQLDDGHVLEVPDVGDLDLDGRQGLLLALLFDSPRAGQTVQGAGFSASMPYFLMASATLAAGISPSSASAFSAATAT